jgi:hypothetical protein
MAGRIGKNADFAARAREDGTYGLSPHQALLKKLAGVEELEALLGKNLPEGDALRSKVAAYEVSKLISGEPVTGKKAKAITSRLKAEYPGVRVNRKPDKSELAKRERKRKRATEKRKRAERKATAVLDAIASDQLSKFV